MKPANKKIMSVNGLFNNEQNNKPKVTTNTYLKTMVLFITLSVATIFSKQIQDTLINNYKKSVAFMQKQSNGVISPLGA